MLEVFNYKNQLYQELECNKTRFQSDRPSFLLRSLMNGLRFSSNNLSTCPPSFRVTIRRGWASVLKTHSSRGMTEGGVKRRYIYFRVSARKKLCIMLSFTPVFTWKYRSQAHHSEFIGILEDIWARGGIINSKKLWSGESYLQAYGLRS